MSSSYPDKIRLVHDHARLNGVGKLLDGRLIFQENQFDPSARAQRKFVATYLFDPDGTLVDATITQIGQADDASDGSVGGTISGHAAKYGPFKPADIEVKPFSLSRHGLTFGLVARQLEHEGDDDGEDESDAPWVVDALPGKTMTFHAPWDKGGYEG